MRIKHIFTLFVVSLIFFTPPLCAQKFEYKAKAGDKFRLLSNTRERVYLNDKLLQTSLTTDRTSFEVISETGGVAEYKANFISGEEITDGINRRMDWQEEYNSVFKRDARGKITIDAKYFKPSILDLPMFPATAINVGYVWKNPGIEVLDLRRSFNIQEPYRIPFNASYQYTGEEPHKGKRYKIIKVQYTLSKDDALYLEDTPATYLLDKNKDAPKREGIKKITGKVAQKIYWDVDLGQAAFTEDEFTLVFEWFSGDRYKFEGKTTSELIEAPELDKVDVAENIQKDLDALDVKDAEVKIVDEGISISLMNIQFEADSARLLAQEQQKLDKISQILKKYAGRDVLIAGHTTDSGTKAGRDKLSKERADSVAQYFIKKGVRTPQRIITKGFGGDKPIADNSTEEGREKNRRVEIIILEN